MTIKAMTVNKESKLTHAQAVRDYVVSVIDFEGTNAEKLKFFFGTFESEYGYNVARMGLQKALSEYLRGLPSVINQEFTCYEISKLLVKWEYLNQSDLDSETYAKENKVEKELENYWKYLAMALIVTGRSAKVIS